MLNLQSLPKEDNMIYLWLGVECPNKDVADYDKKQSPNRSLILQGSYLNEIEFSRCYVYARSSLVDLADDHFIRFQLRPTMRYGYIVTQEEMFVCASGIVSKIPVTPENLKKIKKLLLITDEDIDKEPKIISDEQLEDLSELIKYPKFSRIPIFNLSVSTSMIEKKYDCIPNNSSSPLVNQKIIDILLKLAPDDVQFLDAEVHCKDGVLKNYKLLNIINKVKGIDREKSILTMMEQAPDAILRFRYLTYKPGCMGNHKLARDAEYLSHILISEEIKKAFEMEKIKGVRCITSEDYCNLLYNN